MKTKPVIFSGIKPTGIPTLGSFLGAIKNWKQLSADYECLYCVVDAHSITVRQNPEELRYHSRGLLAWYIALGLDPVKNTLYHQSQVSAHMELAWILNCFTYVGELNRMTQFKDKSAKNEDNINAGLYTYPVLMAADILLYQTDLVPIGDDQKQHLELARDVAERFNKIYGDIFVVPEPYIAKVGARIMGLQNPDKKMSKSEIADNENDCILLSDEPNTILKKFKRAVTDSGSEIKFAPEKPGVSNLLSIYSCITGKTIAESEADFEGKMYGHLKTTVGELVVDTLKPYQEEQARLMTDIAYLDKVATEGAMAAAEKAATTLEKVKKAVGFVV